METNLIENIDYYIDENGLFVFTKEYHLKRGYCCGSGCKHCPWKSESDGEKVGQRRLINKCKDISIRKIKYTEICFIN